MTNQSKRFDLKDVFKVLYPITCHLSYTLVSAGWHYEDLDEGNSCNSSSLLFK